MRKTPKDYVPVMRNYLVQYRMKLGISQYEVSRRAGFLQSEYNLIENGFKGNRMDARKLTRLANALNVPVEQIVKDECGYLELFEAKNGREKKWY